MTNGFNVLKVHGVDFTIVTPSFGQLDYLACCIASVADQEGVTVEHIVQDGGTPGFAEFAKEMKEKWPNRQGYERVMISEPDQGMYDAVNRGLSRAKGNICSQLNSDEQITVQGLAVVKKRLEERPKADICYGQMLVVDQKGNLITLQRPVKMDWRHVATSHLPNFTCTTFFRRSMLLRERAFFDLGYQSCADAIWAIERLRSGTRVTRVDQPTSIFMEMESNQGVKREGLAEAQRIRESMPWWVRRLSWAWKAKHRLRKFILGDYFPRKVEYSLYLAGKKAEKRQKFGPVIARMFWKSRYQIS